MKWFADISMIKSQIIELYTDNPAMSPYQSYDFMKLTGKGMVDKQPLMMLSMHEINAALFDDNGNILVVAPLLYQKRRGTYHVYLRGQWTSAAHLDFLYRTDHYSFDMFSEVMDSVEKWFERCIFHFSKIPSISKTAAYIERKYPDKHEKKLEACATIVLPNNYDEWFQSLKKSTKQNIRTAYNRMNREQIDFQYAFRENEPMHDDEFCEMIELYTQRLAQKNGMGTQLQRVIYPVLKMAKENNPMTNALRSMTNSCYGYIRLNGAMAACFWGLSCNDGRVIVPRLSINVAYGIYCPGGLLIAESIRRLVSFDSTYTQFDLSCGDEPYKYAYGAISHYNNSYKVYSDYSKISR